MPRQQSRFSVAAVRRPPVERVAGCGEKVFQRKRKVMEKVVVGVPGRVHATGR